MRSMEAYPAARERAMKAQGVMLKAMAKAKKNTLRQAEMLGSADRAETAGTVH
jgi:hypothetical protein